MADMEKFRLSLGSVHKITETRRGMRLQLDEEAVRLDFIRPDVLRVKISQGGTFDTKPTFAVVNDEFEVIHFEIKKGRRKVELLSEEMTATIHLKPFRLSVHRADGSVIFESAKDWSYRYLNDTWHIRRVCAKDDAFLGLGEKAGGLNHNGRKLTMWNYDVIGPSIEGIPASHESDDPQEVPSSTEFDPYYMSINLLYHLPAKQPELAGASFFDNGYRMHFDMTHDDYYEVAADGGQLTEYIFSGPTLKQILHRFTELTGKMQPPPLWALGHHQCRWEDYTQHEFLELANLYRKHKVPCDSLWLDIGYMDDYQVFTWNKERFPDPHAALQKIKADGFRTVTIVDPGVCRKSGYPVYEEGRERNLFCKTESGSEYVGKVWPGQTVFPDFVKSEAQEWWGRLNAEHVDHGIDGIWNDMNEPATGGIPDRHMRFDRDGANHPHERYHNQYASLMAQATRDGLKRAHPERRTFILSRAGFAGIQRSAANWTGDNFSRWEHLAMSVWMNGNVGLSGQPFVGSDIGGFCDDASEELLVRWYQYGALMPFMRNHSCKGTRLQYPWSFSKSALKKIRTAIEVRYQLLPYLYTAFMDSCVTGDPVQRPMIYEFQDDPETIHCEDQFMLGNDLLVAPVTSEGAACRELYLPTGDWYDFHTGEQFTGGRRIVLKVDMNGIPIFVRAGAILPLAPIVQSTADYQPREFELRIYVPHDDQQHRAWLHEDDGLTNAHQRGDYWRTDFLLQREDEHLTLQSTVEGGGFPEFQRERFRITYVGIDHPEHFVHHTDGDFYLQVQIPSDTKA